MKHPLRINSQGKIIGRVIPRLCLKRCRDRHIDPISGQVYRCCRSHRHPVWDPEHYSEYGKQKVRWL